MTSAATDRNFKNYTTTQEEEDAYDYVAHRTGGHPTSLVGSIAHLVKGALGSGILAGHVAYMKAGVGIALPVNILCGFFLTICLYLLVKSVQRLMRRTRQPYLSYADAGEAAVMIFPNKTVSKYAKHFRYWIDALIMLDLFGSCCTYQIIIAKSLKQLVENTQKTTLLGPPGYPDLRMYIAMLIPLVIILCLIRHLKYLAPFSVVANGVIVACICMAMYYCAIYNPRLEDMVLATSYKGGMQYIGMQVFSMSCSGLVIPVESNMKRPDKFPQAISVGMVLITLCTICTSFFGYAAFLEDSSAPITINFPMTTIAKVFKFGICLMIYVTHAVNFWVPFNLLWFYLKKRYTTHLVMWERIWRAICVIIIGTVGIIFPAIDPLMSFIGCFCLANMAIIWPNLITLLVIYERPGYGRFKWRLWRGILFMILGIFIWICGSMVNFYALIELFMNPDPNV